MEYRNLTSSEIETLKKHGCSSSDWSGIEVKEGFDPDAVYEVHFFGNIRIGAFNLKGKMSGGYLRGLYHSVISDSEIGDNVRIADVKLLHRYKIGNHSVIERVSEISMQGESSFGNGQVLDILNEGGGRELMIYDEMTSQIAYMVVLYQNDPELITTLKSLISDYVATKKSTFGTIGEKVSISNTAVIRNVWVGDSARIDGVQLLSEGSLISAPEDPAIVGEAVVAKNFIIHHGSVVESSALLDKVFVGQGVRIGKQFSAENSAFFANCEGFHGEAVSLFAGPYSVTHHKSTLLIAAMTSFYNAGSGTNQSNHMYKLGPLHQGIIERGSKTGSFAYLLWPCRVGAYSVVMGKHGGNFDTSDFPFSYITIENGKSFLTPGMNLITVGTRRDVEKWPARDRRKSMDKLDLITFDWLNPLIAQKALQASRILDEIYQKTPKEQDSITYKGVRIKRLLLKSCRRYYDMLIPIFLGEQIKYRMDNGSDLKPESQPIDLHIPWIDMAGMVTRKSEEEQLINMIKSGVIKSLEDLRENISTLNNSYADLSWNWALSLMAEVAGKPVNKLDKEDFSKMMREWKDNKIKLNNLILADAKKEFDQSSRIGFGMDGDDIARDRDFGAVRGDYENNKFIKGLKAENSSIEKFAETALGKF